MSNLETAQQLYQAFKRRDLPFVLSRLSDELEWQYGQDFTNAPWQTPRRGKTEVIKYFQGLELLEIVRLETKTFLEAERVVLVMIDAELIVKSNGNRIIEEDAIHIWRFDAQGQVVRFRNRCDTIAHQLAYDPAHLAALNVRT
jgi:ketosteroid isomerase-like protein